MPSRSLTLLGILLCHLYMTELAFPAEFGDVELSMYVLGSWPRNQDLFNQGAIASTSVQEGVGAGLTVGLFPSALHGILGLAFDSNIHSGALAFSSVSTGQAPGTDRSDLLVSNTTANLILRYPGEHIHPYVGIGVGWSSGVLLNPNVSGRMDEDFESAYALVHQYLGGGQLVISPKWFLFGEYRYVSANYHWDGLAIDFRTHYGLVGAGLRF